MATTKQERTQTLFTFINSREVRAIITIIGAFVVIFNLYLASKLSPLAYSIDALTIRANTTDNAILQFIPRAELEATLRPIQGDVVEIKQDVKEIRQLLNQHLLHDGVTN